MSQPRIRTIEWTDPQLTSGAIAGRTGLAFMQAIAAGTIPQPPIGATMSFGLVAVEPGVARFEGTPAEYLYNPMSTVHGGWACTLLDSAMSGAVITTLGADDGYTTAQLAVHLTRAITVATGRVTAEGRVVSRGSRIVTAEGRLMDAGGKLLAHGTTTCLLMPRGRP